MKAGTCAVFFAAALCAPELAARASEDNVSAHNQKTLTGGAPQNHTMIKSVNLALDGALEISLTNSHRYYYRSSADGTSSGNNIAVFETPDAKYFLERSGSNFTLRTDPSNLVLSVDGTKLLSDIKLGKRLLPSQSEKASSAVLTSNNSTRLGSSELQTAIAAMKPSSACEESKVKLLHSFSTTLETMKAAQSHSDTHLVESAVEHFTEMLQRMHITASTCSVMSLSSNERPSARNVFDGIIEPNARHCGNSSPYVSLAAAAGGEYNCIWDTSRACFYDGGDKYCWYNCTPTGESSGGSGNIYNVSGGTVSSRDGGIPYGAEWDVIYPGGNEVIVPGDANPFQVDTGSVMDRYWNYGSVLGGSRLIDNLEAYGPGGFCPGDI